MCCGGEHLLLARPNTKEALVRQLRDYLHELCFAVGLPARIVPRSVRDTGENDAGP